MQLPLFDYYGIQLSGVELQDNDDPLFDYAEYDDLDYSTPDIETDD
jgi:hypothetical protein